MSSDWLGEHPHIPPERTGEGEAYGTSTGESEAPPLDVTIAQAVGGDQAAYARLYEAFAGGIYRLCYSLLLNREDAEDVMQESFVYAFRNLHRFNGEKSAFRTWLYTIAISRCRNQYRRHRIPHLDLSVLLNIGLPAPHSETPEAVFARRSARETLEHALGRLSPRLREAVVLRYAHSLTFREIAEIMDCPPKTAESRVRLAHEALRGILQPEGARALEELIAFASEER
jgi:RNA polymerase sigma-70 factor (ECF subfamily)